MKMSLDTAKVIYIFISMQKSTNATKLHLYSSLLDNYHNNYHIILL